MRGRLLLLLLVLSSRAGAAATMQGVIEGYYGKPWTGSARRDVIAFMGAHHMNTFVYSPKNDEYHRDRWRDPYPADAIADLRATAVAARKAHVTFVYGLTPALDVCYSCAGDRKALFRKLAQLRRARVRRFALLFDDAPTMLSHPEDVAAFGGDDTEALARAQADLLNRAGGWLRRRGAALLFMVPTDYFGVTCHPYHAALAAGLRHKLPIAWTGPGVVAATITGDLARTWGACVPGHAVVLWDNFPVNDAILSANLHLGPLTGRDADLQSALGGHLLNPMTQAHASLVALGTAGAYFADPAGYDPEAAWQATLAELGNGGGLAVLAAQTRSSGLDLNDARALGAAVDAVQATYAGADWESDVDALESEESLEAAAPADIASQLGGTPLADEIAPWVAELGAHTARGAEAVQLLRALKPSFAGLQAAVTGGTLQVSGQVLPPDQTIVATLGPGFVADAASTAARIASPPLSGLVACLGHLTGADIHFCTSYGLNVHGKALYLVLGLPFQLISDRNVHDRLVMLTGNDVTRIAAETPGALTLTADGVPVVLDQGGGFTLSTPLPGSGHVRLVAALDGGESTARAVP